MTNLFKESQKDGQQTLPTRMNSNDIATKFALRRQLARQLQVQSQAASNV